jgi:hypothetical protein
MRKRLSTIEARVLDEGDRIGTYGRGPVSRRAAGRRSRTGARGSARPASRGRPV